LYLSLQLAIEIGLDFPGGDSGGSDVFKSQGERIQPEHKEMVTVYFSDIVGFTKLSSTIDSSKVTDLLDRLYRKFDALADRYEVHSLETIGDGACQNYIQVKQSKNCGFCSKGVAVS